MTLQFKLQGTDFKQSAPKTWKHLNNFIQGCLQNEVQLDPRKVHLSYIFENNLAEKTYQHHDILNTSKIGNCLL